MVAVIGQQRFRPADITGLNGNADLLQHGTAGSGLATVLLISAVTAGGRITVPAGPTAASHFGDLLIGGVDILHFLLRQISQWIVMVVIGVVLSRQFPVSPFDFFVRGGFRHAKDLIRIVHVLSSTFLRFFLSSSR